MSAFRREHNGVPVETHRSLILGACVENGLPYPKVIPFRIKSDSVRVCARRKNGPTFFVRQIYVNAEENTKPHLLRQTNERKTNREINGYLCNKLGIASNFWLSRKDYHSLSCL